VKNSLPENIFQSKTNSLGSLSLPELADEVGCFVQAKSEKAVSLWPPREAGS
jgi:hypothetical protein